MPWTREQMAARAAQELRDGYYVNLGIGIPTLVSNYIPDRHERAAAVGERHARHGPVPYEGEEDPDLINAGKQTITELPTTSYFSSADSFAMIRGGHIDLVDPRRHAGGRERRPRQLDGPRQDGEGHGRRHGPGRRREEGRRRDGAHAKAKDGTRSRSCCKACTLPLTGAGVVDMVITDLGVFAIDKKGGGGMALVELADGVTLDEIKAKTAESLHDRGCSRRR